MALGCLFGATWLLQLLYWLFVRLRLQRRAKALRRGRARGLTEETPGVSIIVYAHNSEEALIRNIPVLMQQDYPYFEIVVVDDCSKDDTLETLSMLEKRFERLSHTRLTDKVCTISHRKLALLLGVKSARCGYVLTTHAECVPQDPQWLRRMVRHFTHTTDVVIGPVAYENRTGFVARLLGFDLFERLVDLMGLTLSVSPHAGWGANMAFRRDILFANQNRAFASHLMLKPGEDDLFVKEVSNGRNVAVEVSRESVVIDQSLPLPINWSLQRLDRAFTSRYYAPLPRLVKGVERCSRYLFVLSGCALLLLAAILRDWLWLGIACGLFFTRMLWLSIGSYQMSKSLGLHRYVFIPLFADLLTPVWDLWFWIRACLKRHSFDVRRIG